MYHSFIKEYRGYGKGKSHSNFLERKNPLIDRREVFAEKVSRIINHNAADNSTFKMGIN